MPTLQNKYRRLCDYVSFDNYFRFNMKQSSINSDEIDYLMNKINDTECFNNKLTEIYNQIEPAKIIDFINYWDSSFNREKRTKENSICFIENFLSFTDEKLIQFLEEHDIFTSVAKNFIREFNKDNENIITFEDIYDIINKTILYIDNNLFFFVYFIFCQYKFPIDNLPKLEIVDPNNTYRKVIDLLINNVKKDILIKSNRALSILDYLYKSLDLSNFVIDFINEIFDKNEVENLLQILLTAKSLQTYNYWKSYTSSIEFFRNINKEKELKEKLLEIYYNDKYESFKTDNKYIIKGEYKEKKYIVKDVLDFYYGDKISKIKTNSAVHNDDINIEERIIALKLELEKYNEQEIKYSIETSTDEISLGEIKDFISYIKNNQQSLYEKYYSERFELFNNLNVN